MFQFRSRQADFMGEYLFVGGGLGLNGSLNGAIAPSPSDFANGGHDIDLWSDIRVSRPFSADDLNLSYAAVCFVGINAAYGYGLMTITAGWANPLFSTQNVSGWGVGVGIGGAMMGGIWKRLSDYNYR